jgi:hypothetical protein
MAQKPKLEDLDDPVRELHRLRTTNTRHRARNKAMMMSSARGIIMRTTDHLGRNVVREYLVGKGWQIETLESPDETDIRCHQWYDLYWKPALHSDGSHPHTCPCHRCHDGRQATIVRARRQNQIEQVMDQFVHDRPAVQTEQQVYEMHQANLDRSRGQTCSCTICVKFGEKKESEKKEQEKTEDGKEITRFTFLEVD